MPTRKPLIRPVPPSAASSEVPVSLQDNLFPSVRIGSRGSRSIKNLRQVAQKPYLRMLELIRLGAYDHVAAAALGISPASFSRWMREGAEGRNPLSRKFYMDVMEARNQARALAEIEVKKTDPKFWLTRGPGKHSTVMTEEFEDGQVAETVLPGWEDVQHLEVTGPPSPFFAQEPQQLQATATPLQEFAKALLLMEELNILTLTDSFRAASAIPVDSSPTESPSALPAASPSSAPVVLSSTATPPAATTDTP